MIGLLGGPMLAGLFGPEGQDLSSFEGTSVDPVSMLQNANTLIGRVGKGVTDRAASPISLPSSYVQQPPVFTGGGMPMPIGVVGSDPALANPSLLNLQGMEEFQNLFSGVSGGGDSGAYVSPDGYRSPNDESNRYAVPKDSSWSDDLSEPSDPLAATASDRVTRRKAPAQLVRGADLLAEDQSGDDLERAIGAAKLLMQSMQA